MKELFISHTKVEYSSPEDQEIHRERLNPAKKKDHNQKDRRRRGMYFTTA